MAGDKASGADNQQERPSGRAWLTEIPASLGQYLAGFADGEGSFNVSFRPRKDYRMPWKVSMSFNISQLDDTVPRIFRNSLRCGTLRWRADGVCYFEVTDLRHVLERVIPFFDQFPLLSGRSRDFEIFRQIADLMGRGAHRTREGIADIVRLRSPMNRGGKRRYPDHVILDGLEPKESSEAIRQAPVTCTG
ncbi:MAG: LAGLIDADG family homing endonuclease [Acidobacteria bacterium]|nr:LAGLIDADG family homing endonuclease [Acidobacteriota bacterium]